MDDMHPVLRISAELFARGEISRRSFLRTAALLGFGAMGTSLASGSTSAASGRSAGSLSIALPVQAIADPHKLAWAMGANVVFQVCQTLTRTGRDNITRPLLAEGWRASHDLKTWDFFIRKDVHWHDGHPFTAMDAEWNLRRVLDPATGSSTIGLMGGYMLKDDGAGGQELWRDDAIEVRGPHHLRLNLSKPSIAVPEHLFHYANVMMDPREGGHFKPGSNGTGPYRLVEHRVGEVARLKANPHYWGGMPAIENLNFVDVGGEPASLTAALVSHQVDMAWLVDISQWDILEKTKGLVLHKADTANTAMLQMKVTEKPFDDHRVRKALRVAIDCRRVLDIAHRGEGLAGEHHAVCPIQPDYVPLPPMGPDVEAAKKLLREAGYPDGIDIKVAAKNDPPWEVAALQEMKQQYEKAGIRMDIDVMPASRLWEVWDKVPLAFVEWGHRPMGFMVPSLCLRSTAPWNSTGFKDAAFDRLIDEAQAIPDPVKRRHVMEAMERLLQERGPLVQPVWRRVATAVDERVQGFEMHPMAFIFAEELSLKG